MKRLEEVPLPVWSRLALAKKQPPRKEELELPPYRAELEIDQLPSIYQNYRKTVGNFSLAAGEPLLLRALPPRAPPPLPPPGHKLSQLRLHSGPGLLRKMADRVREVIAIIRAVGLDLDEIVRERLFDRELVHARPGSKEFFGAVKQGDLAYVA
jgi:hypothetical protein